MAKIKHGTGAAACKEQDSIDDVKPKTTFSGRTDVDASRVVKTAKAKKVLDQLKRAKSAILSHGA